MAATCNLAVNRPLQWSATDTGGKTLEGFADTLRFVLCTAAVGVQAFLASQCA
ncbi:hypothetical protein D3C84_1301210 [compost metagenome]